jgi:hypothetical protein
VGEGDELSTFSSNPTLDITTAGAIFDKTEAVRSTSGVSNRAKVNQHRT